MRRYTSVLHAAALVPAAGLALLAGSSPVLATEKPLPDTDSSIVITPGTPSDDVEAQIRAALDDLVGRQTQAEINALSEQPFATVLADESGHFLAAVNAGPNPGATEEHKDDLGCGMVTVITTSPEDH